MKLRQTRSIERQTTAAAPPSMARWISKGALGLLALGVATSAAAPAHAFPGFYVGKNAEPRNVHAAHVVVLRQGDKSSVTVMPDYSGPLEPFAMVLAVPADVTMDRVKTLKRNYVDRVEQLTAPRFHEFWEMDPCEPGPAQQEWERNLAASGDTAFLGGSVPTAGDKRVPKELLLTVVPEFKEKSEFGYTLLDETQSKDVVGWLKKQGYAPSDAVAQAVKPYADAGMKFLVAKVDHNAIELIGGDRAVLSPIRFWTETAWDTVPARLGLASIDKHQELFVYVLHPEKRYETKNYKTVVPPTNLEVDFKVKERMGEFYNGLYDLVAQKNPKSFMLEYAWSSQDCGKPCPNEPLMINELLSLGGDVFEEFVPKEQREPAPPDLSDEEQKKLEAEWKVLKPAERAKAKKEHEAQQKELARRKALLERQKYVVTRLHYRYDASSLPDDPQLGTAETHLEGGIGVPKGKDAELPMDVKSAAQSKLQLRYNHFHPWKGMMQCESPERYRWGKAPRTYRGLRKIWVAEDLARKKRNLFVPAQVIQDPVPSLGITPVAAQADAGAPDGGAEAQAPAKEKGCGCAVPGQSRSAGGIGVMLGMSLLGAWFARRRRASR